MSPGALRQGQDCLAAHLQPQTSGLQGHILDEVSIGIITHRGCVSVTNAGHGLMRKARFTYWYAILYSTTYLISLVGRGSSSIPSPYDSACNLIGTCSRETFGWLLAAQHSVTVQWKNAYTDET